MSIPVEKPESVAEAPDLDFLALNLGMIRIGGQLIQPAAIIRIRDVPTGSIITMSQGMEISFSLDQMVEFEAVVRQRREEAKQSQKEAIKLQILAQQEAVNEINNRPVQSPVLLNIPSQGRRGRQ